MIVGLEGIEGLGAHHGGGHHGGHHGGGHHGGGHHGGGHARPHRRPRYGGYRIGGPGHGYWGPRYAYWVDPYPDRWYRVMRDGYVLYQGGSRDIALFTVQGAQSQGGAPGSTVTIDMLYTGGTAYRACTWTLTASGWQGGCGGSLSGTERATVGGDDGRKAAYAIVAGVGLLIAGAIMMRQGRR